MRSRVDLLRAIKEEAKERAKQLVDGHAAELWQGSRAIQRFEPLQMKDYQTSLEKLRRCGRGRADPRLGNWSRKRDLFDRLHRFFNQPADEIEQAMKKSPPATSD